MRAVFKSNECLSRPWPFFFLEKRAGGARLTLTQRNKLTSCYAEYFCGYYLSRRILCNAPRTFYETNFSEPLQIWVEYNEFETWNSLFQSYLISRRFCNIILFITMQIDERQQSDAEKKLSFPYFRPIKMQRCLNSGK